jgi:hypothetical protein
MATIALSTARTAGASAPPHGPEPGMHAGHDGTLTAGADPPTPPQATGENRLDPPDRHRGGSLAGLVEQHREQGHRVIWRAFRGISCEQRSRFCGMFNQVWGTGHRPRGIPRRRPAGQSCHRLGKQGDRARRGRIPPGGRFATRVAVHDAPTACGRRSTAARESAAIRQPGQTLGTG